MTLQQMLPAIVASLLLAEVARSGSNKSCTQESCGNLTIRYPFFLAGEQPLYCGYPSLALTCYGSAPRRAYLGGTFRERLFHVAEISYMNNSMVLAFAGKGDCLIPDFNVSSSLALFPFTISAANKRLVFFYNCYVPPEPRLPQPCGNRTMGVYISALWDSGGKGDALPPGVSRNCMSITMPVRGGMEPARLHYERLIADGFLLELPPPNGDCDGCRRVRGECRFDQLSFQCVCPDGNLCPNATQSNSTTHSGMPNRPAE